MPNSNYVAGRRYEYAVMKRLREEEGYPIVIRSAGSHGAFDVIAINPKTRLELLFQLKTGETADQRIAKLQSLNDISGDYKVKALAISPESWPATQ